MISYVYFGGHIPQSSDTAIKVCIIVRIL
jgi:hypothetical protein